MDWILSVTLLIGTWLLGNKSNKGNAILAISQVGWAWLAINVNKKGLLLSAVVLFFVFSRNWLKWHREAHRRLW